MSSARLRTLLTRPRTRIRAAIASAAAIALATGGLVLASALPAQAHNSSADATCQALTVRIDSFAPEDGPGKRNTLTIRIDGAIVPGYDHAEFGVQPGDDGIVTVPFSDLTQPHDWAVEVVAFDDDGSKDWNRNFDGTSRPCTAPTVAAQASACTAVGGPSTITADLSGLNTEHSYRAELISGGVVRSTKDAGPGVEGAPVDFGPQPSGVTYTVRVTDLTVPGISAETTVIAGSCPKVGGVTIDITACSAAAPDGRATLGITSDGFVPGRAYQVRSGSATGPALGAPFTATDATSYTVPITPAATNTEPTLFVVDVASGIAISSTGQPVTLDACPTTPEIGALSIEPCAVGNTSSDVSFTVSGLTPGRRYQPTIDDQPVTGKEFTARSESQPIVLDVPPGSRTIGIRDAAAPGVAASAPVNVEACALVPKTTINATQCTAPGGSNSLGVTLGDLVIGRSYTVSAASTATTLPAQTFVADQTTAVRTFGAVPTGQTYTVKVVDDAEPGAFTSTVIAMSPCPQVAGISYECTTSGNVGTLAIIASDLQPGDTYTVRIERQVAPGSFTTVSEKTTTNITPADLRVVGVSTGQVYRVSLLDQSNPALNMISEIPVPDGCLTGRVGGVSYTAGGSVSSLALTGTDTGRLALIALLLLVPGAGLIGFAILRHRREVRD